MDGFRHNYLVDGQKLIIYGYSQGAKSHNIKCPTNEKVWKLQVSANCNCLTTANISQQTMSFRPFTESVWQLQMSDNGKYLATDNVF